VVVVVVVAAQVVKGEPTDLLFVEMDLVLLVLELILEVSLEAQMKLE
jgi:hypothetical protein